MKQTGEVIGELEQIGKTEQDEFYLDATHEFIYIRVANEMIKISEVEE